MKAEELRIGNYIARNAQYMERGVIDGELRAKRVTVMQWMEIAAIERDRAECETAGKRYIVETDSLIGIPLTPEWLERFGFEKNHAGYRDDRFYSYDNGVININFNSGLCLQDTPYECDEMKTFNPEFKYVHQLQNLYFALTREELTLKEDVK